MNCPRLALTRLDDRCVPATWGNPWPDAGRLTLSFAPDGTDVGGTPSELYRLFDGPAPAPSAAEPWKGEVLRAFQTWAAAANINLRVVADGGQPLGAAGAPQGDVRFGDVRVVAYPMAPEALALATPYDAAR